MSIIKRNATRVATRRFAPFLIGLDLAKAARAHWEQELSKRQRKRLIKLVRKSGGRPSNLSSKQRQEVIELVKAFDPIAFAKREAKAGIGMKPAKSAK